MEIKLGIHNPNKRLKEEFVSNLGGSALLEIAAVSAIMPMLILLRQWSMAELNYEKDIQRHSESGRQNALGIYIVSLINDFIFVVMPMLACLTILEGWTYIFATFLMVVIFIIFLFRRLGSNIQCLRDPVPSYWSRILSSYRFSMMLVTCLTILAVDFQIFPRRFAKTETYGSGLMDLGVGSFVVANALVSREARNLPPKKHGGILRSVGPLLFLGFMRLIVTKGVDYQVHVGEYGVHWNFFFTLAAVELLTSILKLPPQLCGFIGCLILVVYQSVLLFGLNDFLISNERSSNIFDMNKEGIFSLFGYLGLYFVSVRLGHHFFSIRKPIFAGLISAEETTQLAIEIWLLDGVLWAATIFLTHYVESVSRRMCNLTYVTFVLAQNFEVLGILALSDLIPKRKRIIVEEAFDQNLLAIFLLANLLTGIINMSMNTLAASFIVALCILAAYSAVLVSIAAIPKLFGVKLKYW